MYCSQGKKIRNLYAAPYLGLSFLAIMSLIDLRRASARPTSPAFFMWLKVPTVNSFAASETTGQCETYSALLPA